MGIDAINGGSRHAAYTDDISLVHLETAMATNQIELVLLGSLVVACCTTILWRGPSRFVLALASIACVVVVIDVVAGNWRWQMIPGYLLAFALLFTSLHRRNRPQQQRTNRWNSKLTTLGSAFCLLLCLFVSVMLPWLFPLFSVPSPDGEFYVGVRDIHLVDSSRPEVMTEDPLDHRELMLRVWYPAESVETITSEPLVREIPPLAEIFARGTLAQSFMLSHLQKISSHSYRNAPIVHQPKAFPVLVFSHGNSFYASQNTLLMEHLASHGFIVIGIDHPYQASWVEFPDGRIATYQGSRPGKEELTADELQEMRVRGELLQQSYFAADYDEHIAMMRSFLGAEDQANDAVELWVDDTEFVLDQLVLRGSDPASPFASLFEMLDLDRIGVFGMSLGGATAGVLCARDPRVKAGLNMDGAQFGRDAIDIHLERPFFLFNADRRKNADDPPVPFELNEFVVRQSNSVIYSLSVSGATHASFTDFAIMCRPSAWMIAPVEPWAMKRLMDDYTLAFFNKHLRGTTEPLLDRRTTEHPDVLKFDVRYGQ